MSRPKYLEILTVLRERCSSLATGVRLPAERALAEEFGVSVMTVRRSLAALQDEGWVRRSPGSGTYVGRPTVTMGPTLTSFTEDMRRRGLRPSSTVLRFEPITPDLETVTDLSLRPGEGALLLERLRYADGEPMCHEVGLYPERFTDALSGADLTGSVHEALTEVAAVPDSTFRRVRALVLPPVECELLGLPLGSPGLEIVDTFYDATGRPVQHVRSRYRFDRYEVLTTITRIGGGQPHDP
ncbi:GntR family transcriptional regulator [Nocardiopsis sp. HNM0947]|uniref:GntR family transcriptional regulator n=1 Tax=Nocardiopsis coralli TaxID=2772213 RepID=A0ABR9PBM4_9ACTN|nr:GntR family transcriptional regulator [Nocardiopsis coralli]MBE3001232.1 GntR family transcriptional regulator [Nocardiopsis coralli]